MRSSYRFCQRFWDLKTRMKSKIVLARYKCDLSEKEKILIDAYRTANDMGQLNIIYVCMDEMKKANIQFEVTNVTLAEDGNSAVVEAVVLGSVDLEKGGVKDSVDTKTNLVKIQDKWLVEFKLK